MKVRVTARSDWRYLTKHVQEVSENYYLGAVRRGEPPGVWWGEGAARLGLSGEASERQMEALFGQLADPETAETLGSRPRQYQDTEARLARLLALEPRATPERRAELALQARKSARTAVHYHDVTFSPPKSWSVLHAALERAGRHEEAEAVWQALLEGVDTALGYMATEAGYARAGYHGRAVAGRTSGRWVDAHDWTVALFRHHTSRDGDPQLHIHAALLNRAVCEDGVYRSLDSKALHRVLPAVEAIAAQVAEARLSARLGVRFATRPDGVAREIVGISPATRELFSSRTRALRPVQERLIAAYEAAHGHRPSPYNITLMAEAATLSTRARKPELLPTRSELLADWEERVRAALGDSLDSVLQQALQPDRAEPGRIDRQGAIWRAIGSLEASRSAWSRYDLMHELERLLPGGLHDEPLAAVALLRELTEEALKTPAVTRLTGPELVSTPAELRRADGRSIYEPHEADRYTATSLLSAEARLMTAAHSTGAPAVARPVALEAIPLGRLGADQLEAAVGVMTDGRQISVICAPAGTGKTRLLGEVAAAWQRTMHRPVLGLAVSQNAAGELRGAGVPVVNNVRLLFARLERAAGAPKMKPKPPPRRPAGKALQRKPAPRWKSRAPIEPGQLVLLDEASMVSTLELERIRQVCRQAEAKLVVVGDDAQLASVGAGGAFRLLVEARAYELTEVRRFEQAWEADASLQLRTGTAAALLAYEAHGRLLDGSAQQMRAAAVRRYAADVRQGRSSLLVVRSNELAAEVSSQVRAELVKSGQVEATGVRLHDGTVAGRGDLVQTRRNNYRLRDPEGEIVTNRYVYRVVQRRQDGSLRVQRRLETGWGGTFSLPGHYVKANVELAYAVTSQAAQGRTVDTGYILVDAQTSREGLYVGLSRGRRYNQALVIRPDDVRDFDRLTVLTQVLASEARDQSATAVLRQELTASESLARLGPIWTDLVQQETRGRYEEAMRKALGTEQGEAFCRDAAAASVYQLLRNGELSGRDVAELVSSVVQERPFTDARSIAEVLHWRLSRRIGPLPAHVLQSFSERTPDGPGTVTHYLQALAAAMDARVAALGEVVAQDGPAWAVAQMGPVPADALERADWAQRAAWVAAYREQYGYESSGDAIGPAPARYHSEAWLAWHVAFSALGRPAEERAVAALSDSQLATQVAEYEQEAAWAPAYVAEELSRAHRTRQLRQVQVAEATAARVQASGGAVAEATRRLERAQILQRRAEGRLAHLEIVHEARQQWYAATAASRQAADLALRELERRHGQPPRAEGATRDAAGGIDARLDLPTAVARARAALEELARRAEPGRQLSTRDRLEQVRELRR